MNRRLVLFVARIGIAILILELGALGAYVVSRKQSFSYAEMWRRLEVVARVESRLPVSLSEQRRSEHQGRMLTPFYGWARPSSDRKSIDEYGLPNGGGASPIVKRSSSTINVLFMGGSVAEQCVAELTRGLSSLSHLFRDRQVVVVSAAIGGYKQPQQLYLLSYLALMGAEFDIVINLDGFNEVYVAGRDNRLYGSNPFYPVYWKALAQSAPSAQVLKDGGVIALLESLNASLARLASRPPFRYSVFSLVLWDTLHEFIARKVTEKTILVASGARDLSGPAFDYSNNERLVRELVRVWTDSSRQIANLSKLYGFQYFHFLQPNHFIHTKTLTKEEEFLGLCATCDGETSMANLVQKAFPMMSANARLLEQGGANFKDLTPIFKDEVRHIYGDKTCHFTPVGNNLIVEHIVDFIARRYKES
jgi:hypothetical protein